MSNIKCSTAPIPDTLDKNFWDERWKTNDTGWDLNTISPPLQNYFDQMTCKNKSILIPGCGNAYEADYLLQQGYKNITIIDISLNLTQSLLQKFSDYVGKELTVICGDFFKHSGQYDFIIEQTFFCALEPSRRTEYIVKMQSLLKEEGILAGLLFNTEFKQNPPFGGSIEEYDVLFSSVFTIQKMEITQLSITPRLGTEIFFEVRNKLSK